MFAVTKLMYLLLEPSNMMFIAFATAVALMRPSRLRWPLRLICVLFLVIWISPLSDAMLGSLEDRYAQPELPARIDGVIVLGGWQDLIPAASRGGILATNDAGERLIIGAGIARRYPDARLVFTGGSGDPRFPGLKETIVGYPAIRELGIPADRVTFEDRSRNTAENAKFSYELVKPRASEIWVLVTSASHMARSRRCFDALGWTVIPYPVDFRSAHGGFWFRDRKIAEPINRFGIAMYEWTGLAVYRLYSVF
ncbi:MAG: YdcF family protein [Bryobacterales bacterium]|nr:YdcF family protein [Bryobacterales bacterium]